MKVGNDVTDAAAAPARRGLIEQLVRSLREFVEHRRGCEFVRSLFDRLRLDHSGKFVGELVPGLFILEMLPLIETDETDYPFHVVRIRIARRSLENKRR